VSFRIPRMPRLRGSILGFCHADLGGRDVKRNLSNGGRQATPGLGCDVGIRLACGTVGKVIADPGRWVWERGRSVI
jgi:hypothetical protein